MVKGHLSLRSIDPRLGLLSEFIWWGGGAAAGHANLSGSIRPALQFISKLDILLDIAVAADSGQHTSETRDQELSEASPQARGGPVRGSGARRRPRPHPIARPTLGGGRARRLPTAGCSQPNDFRRATKERRHS